MTHRSGRGAIAAVLILAAIAGSSLAQTQQRVSATSSATAFRYSDIGVPGSVAAKALNALATHGTNRSTRSVTGVRFILNWLPNVEFAGLWVAQKYGWWQKAGINMSFEPWSASVHPEVDVPQKGGNTFGFQSGAAIAIARSQNVPIEALYTDTQRSVFGLTVLAKSHINKLTDLRGKRIGYQPHELYVPETMLASVGLKINTDWKPVPVGFDIVQLTQGQVDAYLTFLTNEPISLNLQGVKNHSFAASDYGYHFYDDVMFTHTGLIKSNPGLVRKVVGIVARGFTWAHTHPDQAARLTINSVFPSGKSDGGKQQILEMRSFTPFSRDSQGGFGGRMSTSYWQDSINTLFKYGEIKSKPNAATIFTNQFNPNK